jgi:hypothetical protein
VEASANDNDNEPAATSGNDHDLSGLGTYRIGERIHLAYDDERTVHYGPAGSCHLCLGDTE